MRRIPLFYDSPSQKVKRGRPKTKREKKEKVWTPWDKSLLRGIGTTENPMNATLVGQINCLPGFSVHKIGGNRYNVGRPDIMGMAPGGPFLGLENKFVKKIAALDATVVLHDTAFTVEQRKYFEGKAAALRLNIDQTPQPFRPIMGSIVGVMGDHPLLLALPLGFILDHSCLRVQDLKAARALGEKYHTSFVIVDRQGQKFTACGGLLALLESMRVSPDQCRSTLEVVHAA